MEHIQQQELTALLGDGAELLTIDERKKQPKKFTAGRIAQDEKKLAAVIEALVNGFSKTKIASTFGISRNTISAIEEKYPEKVEQYKKGFARAGKQFISASMERLNDEFESIDIDKLAVSMAVVFDKVQIVEGGPTIIHGQAQAPHKAINDLVDALEVEAEFIEEPETGCEPGKRKQIAERVEPGSIVGGVDIVSSALPAVSGLDKGVDGELV